MKKSLIAFAALASIAGAASAQSSVTLYGRVDLAVGKAVGTNQKGINNGSGSRLGFRGVEDLGGGMSAFFNIETRFDADTGAAQQLPASEQGCTAAPAACADTDKTNGANRFWSARSIVGLQGGFGKITLGREYTTAFLGSQLIADPWAWDTAASGTPGQAPGVISGLNQILTGLGIARVRNDSSLTYNFSAAGFSAAAQIAEATDSINAFTKKPVNFSLGYAAGPLMVAMGYEKTGQVAAAAAKVLTVNGSFDLGAVKLGAMYGKGTTATNNDRKSWMLTAVAPLGQGEFRASYGKATNTNTAGAKHDLSKGFALGYHYALSKRTTLYTDFVRNTGKAAAASASPAEPNGYDFGIKHNF